MREHRRIIVTIKPSVLFSMLKMHEEDVGHFIGASYDHETDTFLLKLEDDTFEIVPEGEKIPRRELFFDSFLGCTLLRD